MALSVQQAEQNLQDAVRAANVAAEALAQAQAQFPPNSAAVNEANAALQALRREAVDALGDLEDARAATNTAQDPYFDGDDDIEADIVITVPDIVDEGVTGGTGFTPDVPVDPGIISAVEAQRRAGVASTDDAGINIFGGSDGDVEGVSFDPAVLVPDNDPAISSIDDTGIGDFQAVIGSPAILAPDNDPAFEGIDDLGIEGLQATIDNIEEGTTNGLLDVARNQAAYRETVNSNSSDWRVKMSLAPGANYLYKDPTGPGILAPLVATNGVIFPYTPRFDISYQSNYTDYDLTHTNYKQYFYKNSFVSEILLTADFTAQDTAEADYLLAAITFFKSCTKMFYGQDPQRGSPPPLVFIKGLGNYQFNNHPCVIRQFNYNLPDDVDYIRANNVQISNSGFQFRKPLASTAAYSLNLDSIWARLTGAGLQPGAEQNFPPPTDIEISGDATYVPTKMTITLDLLPIVSRQQVSQQFSLKDYANGTLLKGGYW